MYDTAIIGTGAAGISAALTLKSRNKSILLLGRNELSKKMTLAEQIRNYPGLGIISGKEMAAKMEEHLQSMNIGITDKQVTAINKAGDHFDILCGIDTFQAYTVILAMGAVNASGYPGEEELLGKGVSYCATCDGFLYSGKPIAVVCSSKEFESEIDYLAQTASEVYLAVNYQDAKEFGKNVHVISGKNFQINGKDHVEAVEADGKEIAVDAVFIMRDAIAPAVLLKEIAVDGNHIRVSRECRTNIKGCYAAGDCTGRPYQYVKAAGEGNVAAHSVLEYLAENGMAGNSKTRPYKKRPLSFQDAIEVTDLSDIPTDEMIRNTAGYNLTQGKVRFTEKDKAGNGDVIRFSAEGGKGRFNRENLRLTLGQNLYDYDIEKELVGASAGDKVIVEKEGDPVTITVAAVYKTENVEPTDEMVKALGDETISTFEEYYLKLRNEMQSNAINLIAYKVFSELLVQEPDPDVSAEVIQRLGELELGFFDQLFKGECGKGIYEMSPQELKEKLGVETAEEFRRMRTEWYQMKYKQVHVFAKALGIELKGKYDYMTNYEALSLLQAEGVERIKKAVFKEGEKND